MRRGSSWKPEGRASGCFTSGSGGQTAADEEKTAAGGAAGRNVMPQPDGPLSWMVAVVCFLVNMISSGFFRCAGLFFNATLSTFGVSRGEASLPLSIYGGFFNLSAYLKDLSGRWSPHPQEYDLTIVYKLTRTHSDADCRSAAPVHPPAPDFGKGASFLSIDQI
ncbi:uncharacterized protein LOC144164809 [Haemaphysalis longicornis]